MNQLVTVQQGFLCTPLEGVWSLQHNEPSRWPQ